MGVLAALVQRLDTSAATSLAGVEGLAAALLDVMAAAADMLAKCVRQSGGNSGPTGPGGSPKASSGSGGSGMFGGGGGVPGSLSSPGLYHSSNELPDIALLDQAAHQLLWSVAVVASLSRSAAVAARFASLKALTPALLAALKVGVESRTQGPRGRVLWVWCLTA